MLFVIMVMMMLMFLVIVIMMMLMILVIVFMMAAFVIMVVMMMFMFMLFHNSFQKLCFQILGAFNGFHDLFAVKLVPRGCNDSCLFIMLTDQSDTLVDLFLAHFTCTA